LPLDLEVFREAPRQELLGHPAVRTTLICTPVLDNGGAGIRSALNALAVAGEEVGCG
jgi:hypothetical protein